MSNEGSVLDAAERGEHTSHATPIQGARPQANGGNGSCASEPAAQTKHTATDTESECDTLENARGPVGLARLKEYDNRFAFYPGFSVERSLALEFRAENISRLGIEVRNLRKELDAAESGKPAEQPLTDSAERMAILMSRLAESMAQYDAAWVHGKMVNSTISPEKSSLDQLRLWLEHRSDSQLDLYRNREWHEFRMFSLPNGPLERCIKVLAPLTKIGHFILRPLQARKVPVDDLELSRYDETGLSWIVGVVLLVGICIFLILPLALLTCFDTNRNVRMGLILAMCFMVSCFARVIEPDEARQIIFICVYSAVMSGFLSQVS